MNDYKESLGFWDSFFEKEKGYKVEAKFVQSERLNEIFKTYIKEDSKVLDYGTGSGWGIFEIYLTQKFEKGLGIDLSSNSIRVAKECCSLSDFNNIEFVCGDEDELKKYPNYFDFIFSTNVLDVVPDEITNIIIDSLYDSLKKGGYVLICLNPAFTTDELENLLKMERKGNYYYKNNILRCNHKSIEEWNELFRNRFELVASEPFKLMDQEKFERRFYLLRK